MLCHVFIKLQRTGLNPAGFQQRFDLEHVGIQYRWTAHRHRKNFLSQFSDCPSLSIWRAQTGASAVRPASPLHSWLTTEISKVSKNVVRTVKSVQTWHTHGKQFAVSICWNNFEETENSRKKKKKKAKIKILQFESNTQTTVFCKVLGHNLHKAPTAWELQKEGSDSRGCWTTMFPPKQTAENQATGYHSQSSRPRFLKEKHEGRLAPFRLLDLKNTR